MTTAVRILDIDDPETVIASLHDPDQGSRVRDEIIVPTRTKRQRRRKYARVGGSFGVGATVPDDGTVIVPMRFFGPEWTDANTAAAILDDIVDLDEFYLEVELSGVTTRWYCDAPVDILPEPIGKTSRVMRWLDQDLRFLVQPNPTVTIEES
jgi:hypothetical protein